MERYTIRDFRTEFPDEDACLGYLMKKQWPNGVHCQKCRCITEHHRMSTRRSYSCQECGNHLHPTAGTIFENTRTPLDLWFYVIFLMAKTRGGIAAKQIERELGVTYKTAWRMCRLIRTQLHPDSSKLSGKVEMDETYIGGKRRGRTGRPAGDDPQKTPVVGIAERGGQLRAEVVPDVAGRTLIPMTERLVERGSTVYTDEYGAYNKFRRSGYEHARIQHRIKIWVSGDVHTNTIEGFWSLFKCGVRGVYRHISRKYLQHYVDEYSFRYNYRHSTEPMFKLFLHRMALLDR